MGLRHGRGVALACSLFALAALCGNHHAQAGEPFRHFHTIPRETLAKDFRTGDVMYAPPIPYGHYVKDYGGCVHAAAGSVCGVLGKICGACKGLGCGLCGGNGCLHGNACGSCGGKGCGACGGGGLTGGTCGGCHGAGCGLCGNRGLFGGGVTDPGCGVGGYEVRGHGRGLLGKFGHGNGGGLFHHGAVATVPAVIPSAQTVPSAQTGKCGLCGGTGLCKGMKCGGCGGAGLCGVLRKACGACGGLGLHGGNRCGGCGGSGLCGGDGLCSGNGLFGHKHGGDPACGSCGGKGCNACGGTGLLSHVSGSVHNAAGLASGAVHQAMYKAGIGGIEYFVGPGGPVPLTPGYVPYVVPVRSPRDYFAFPPYSEREF